MNTPRRLAAEGIGSVLLAAAVVGSGVMAERLAGGNAAVALLGEHGSHRRGARDPDRALGSGQRCAFQSRGLADSGGPRCALLARRVCLRRCPGARLLSRGHSRPCDVRSSLVAVVRSRAHRCLPSGWPKPWRRLGCSWSCSGTDGPRTRPGWWPRGSGPPIGSRPRPRLRTRPLRSRGPSPTPSRAFDRTTCRRS